MATQRKQWTIDDVKALAESKGGKLLTLEYLGWRGKYRWRCASGHEWESDLRQVALRGGWCKECLTGSDVHMRKLSACAEQRGGRCLSLRYEGAKSKMQWICAAGHEWTATPNNILNGRWCPTCARGKVNDGRRRTIDELQRCASERGGTCLSTSIANTASKLKWRCAEGHEWQATAASILAGSWCQKCGYNRVAVAKRSPTKLEEVSKLAIARGGKCLSKDYVNVKSPLAFECHNGHRFTATPSDVENGRWCARCSAGRGERIVREHFEQLFDREFPRGRPSWLISPRGTKYELDGYCPDLQLAFEHHGAYHYRLESLYSKSEADLSRRQENDRIKRELCAKHGVALIEIAEVPTMTTLVDLKKLIIRECAALGRPVPKSNIKRTIDLSPAYKPESMFSRLQQSAAERGGELVSTEFLGNSEPLVWICAKGHQWSSTPFSVYWAKSWCPICSGVKKKTLGEMQELARSRGGECLSTEFSNVRTKMQWRCSAGHVWSATPTSLTNRNSWCPYCAGQKGSHLTIERMREVALERGGKCLSDAYCWRRFNFDHLCRFNFDQGLKLV